MATPKAPHHRGTHHVASRRVRQAAYANPATVCQAPNCKGWGNRTLAEHPRTKTGKPPRWQAGHVVDGQIGGPYRPEVDVCNTANGAVLRNTRSEPHSEKW